MSLRPPRRDYEPTTKSCADRRKAKVGGGVDLSYRPLLVSPYRDSTAISDSDVVLAVASMAAVEQNPLSTLYQLLSLTHLSHAESISHSIVSISLHTCFCLDLVVV